MAAAATVGAAMAAITASAAIMRSVANEASAVVSAVGLLTATLAARAISWARTFGPDGMSVASAGLGATTSSGVRSSIATFRTSSIYPTATIPAGEYLGRRRTVPRASSTLAASCEQTNSSAFPGEHIGRFCVVVGRS